MARKGKARKVSAPKAASAKDRRRAAVPGRHDQGMGRAGKAGGTKSAGGKGGRVQGGMRGGDRGGWKSGGGVPSPAKARGPRAERGRPPSRGRPGRGGTAGQVGVPRGRREVTDMDAIVPRWEWRSFGSGFGAADPKFAALTPDSVLESDEVYLLSSASGDNIKIRDRLMDVKALQQVNADGLEQWKPVMKGSFPLAAADVAKVFAAFRVPAPALARPAYTLDEFVAELMDARRGLRALPVHKSRRRFRIDGCMSERTEVTAGGKKVLTVALESEDPALVVATVRKMGLAGLPNVNYTKGLKQLVGMPA